MRLPSSARAARCLVAALAACGHALVATRATAQQPATVPTALAAELIDAGLTLRAAEAPSVVVGRLPDGFPSVPLSPSARVLGGARWRTGSAVALVQVEGAPAEARLRAFAALESAGWTVPPPAPDFADDNLPRFRPSALLDPERDATRCAPSTATETSAAGGVGTGASAVVVGVRARDGGAIVRLLALPAARATRCRPTPRLVQLMADRWARPPVPALLPPPGVRVQPNLSYESGQSEATATARVLADSATGTLPTTASLLAHYGRALATGGWVAVPVPAWDSTRATPLFVSPADSAGARWAASVDVRPDTSRPDTGRPDIGREEPSRPESARAAPALVLQLRVSQVGVAPPGNWHAQFNVGMAASSDVRIVGVSHTDPAAARPHAAGPPVARELVDALLGSVSGIGGDMDEDAAPSSRLTDGRPPAGWRAPIPAMPGARVLGGYRSSDGLESFGSRLVLVVTAPGTPAAVAAAYGRALDGAGWRSPSLTPAMEADMMLSGFLASPTTARGPGATAHTQVRCAPDGDGYLTGAATTRAAGRGTLLRLTLLRGVGSAGCTPAERAELVRANAFRPPVSSLTAPAGLVVEQGQSSGGGLEWRMAATVRGAVSPAAIVAAYAPQLRRAGWTVDSAAASLAVAAAPLHRIIAAAATDTSAAAPNSAAASLAAMFAGPQDWSGLLTASRRADGAYAVTLDVRRALGRER